MSMSPTQSAAFLAAGGFPASEGYRLFAGIAVTVAFLWAAWAIYSCYRGWATGNLDRSIAATSVIRTLLLCLILTAFVLS
ncbi:integrating conjugative element protein, PFL_4701 family [Pseudomonas gessardii]|uniref:TIGR03758 family integrating conjugative element protein n=1 Tax=Pseudomonas gessardii TaxID=78544 RepID=A0A7Y1MV87_9PSED|nr:TIGR03758 family integrating conjugative element protein [Pseudomonas gessardii]MRU50129.1 TIGR03758 family integrating conjugative element protein [Pseudomonas gessardii]NNA98905.1 TIGR03758 family integrating conjugative element protein [Pseudomonas gessardii]ONH46329.1 integrating conjugative element protein [Pseudomonas gessardii]SDR33672.1 integrating conjugative element protein, PFL_4701 family [Pseudomonas gessardii]